MPCFCSAQKKASSIPQTGQDAGREQTKWQAQLRNLLFLQKNEGGVLGPGENSAWE